MPDETPLPETGDQIRRIDVQVIDIRFTKMETSDLTLMSALQKVYNTLAADMSENDREAALNWFFDRNQPPA